MAGPAGPGETHDQRACREEEIMAKIISIEKQTGGEVYVANFNKAGNIKRIAEILEKNSSADFVEALLEELIEFFGPEDRLKIISESDV